MGIADLWDLMKPGFGKRIRFEKFVSDFIDEHGRTPRIAIDAYVLIFQSVSGRYQGYEGNYNLIRNFMAKLLYLVSLNVSFVVVFDGAFKPDKLKTITEGMNFERELEEFKSIDPKKYSDRDFEVAEEVKIELLKNGIDILQAPGEGEAECSQLQRFGIVDFVMTNDLDSFIFGASKVLRNFSRYFEDEFPSPTKRLDPTPKYYITIVDMSTVEQATGLNRERMIFLATLRGGDYSSGISKIGIKYATRLALCGTERYGLSKFPDFANWLIKCFVKDKNDRIFGYSAIKDSQSRKGELKRLVNTMNQEIKQLSKQMFGRKLNLNYDLDINEYFTLLYLFPRVNRLLFKFVPHSLSFGHLNIVTDDIKVPLDGLINIEAGTSDVVKRMHNLENIGVLEIWFSTDGIEQKYMGYSESLLALYIPESYYYSLKSIIMKALSNLRKEDSSDVYVEVTNNKEDDDCELLMIKFDAIGMSESLKLQTSEIKRRKENDPSKLEYTWFPRSLVQMMDPSLVKEYDKRGKKISPRKRKPSQKTTLDDLGQFPKSPTKRARKLSPSKPSQVQRPVLDFFKTELGSSKSIKLEPSFIRMPASLGSQVDRLVPSSPTKKKSGKSTNRSFKTEH
ncbi:uncharacterized protein PRCAT00006343001 [Priceomyces carsonii]|uniref:uncharacterized protein n=1 Tax=Priceomyces carsonii TaxID=28549 RepID=UPI002ED7C3ED|nr:unnamed protein product [Priceomyces carsonii]